MIHICYGLHDNDGRYSKYVGASMASIFERTLASVTIHIIHDQTLNNNNRENFSYLAGRYNQIVKFYNVEEVCPNQINYLKEKKVCEVNPRFGLGAFYRLLIKQIFSFQGIEKVIYLDADIIVNLDIMNLWQYNLENYSLASVPELFATQGFMIADRFLINNHFVKIEDYFCSGVIMFNIEKISDDFFMRGIDFLVNHPECYYTPDQDVLNAFFSTNYLRLDQMFNSFTIACELLGQPISKRIYHYAGQSTLGLDLKNPYQRLFLEAFTKTPWFNIEALGRIGDEIRNMNNRDRFRSQYLLKISKQNRRVFFISFNPKTNVEYIKAIFCAEPEDEFINDSNDQNSKNILIQRMHEENESGTIFFIFRMDFEMFVVDLLKQGFVEWRNYMDGLRLLTKEQSGRLSNEFSFINVM